MYTHAKKKSHVPLSPYKKHKVFSKPQQGFLCFHNILPSQQALSPFMKIALLKVFTSSSTLAQCNFSTDILWHCAVTLWVSKKASGGKVFLPAWEKVDYPGLYRTELNSLHSTQKSKIALLKLYPGTLQGFLALSSSTDHCPLCTCSSLPSRSFPTKTLLCAHLLFALHVILHNGVLLLKTIKWRQKNHVWKLR